MLTDTVFRSFAVEGKRNVNLTAPRQRTRKRAHVHHIIALVNSDRCEARHRDAHAPYCGCRLRRTTETSAVQRQKHSVCRCTKIHGDGNAARKPLKQLPGPQRIPAYLHRIETRTYP